MPALRLSSLRSLVLPLLTFALVLGGCGGSGDSSSESNGDEIAYSVGSPVADSTIALIVSSEFGTDTLTTQRYQRQLQMQMRRRSPSQRSGDQMQETHRQLVQGFAGQHVMRGTANERDIQVSEEKVDARLEKYRSRYQSEEKFQKLLAKSGLTIDSLRSRIADQLQTRALQQDMADTAEQPSESEVQSYSQENKRIRAQHILLRAGQNAQPTKIDSARQAAQSLIDSLQAGAEFAALAERHSEGPTSRQGGDLGYFTRDKMDDDFADAAYALADSGDITTEPVRTRFGFHIIRLTDPGQPMDTSKARKRMMQERRREAFDSELNQMLEGVTVRVNPNVVQAGLSEES